VTPTTINTWFRFVTFQNGTVKGVVLDHYPPFTIPMKRNHFLPRFSHVLFLVLGEIVLVILRTKWGVIPSRPVRESLVRHYHPDSVRSVPGSTNRPTLPGADLSA